MERDPHQLIEGVLHRLLRRRLRRRPSSTCAARWPSPRSASPQALNEAYAAGYVGKNILGTDFSRRHRAALGRRRLHRRRGDRRSSRASRATGACPASSRRSSRRPRASTCSRRSSTTSRRCRTSRGSSPTAATRSPRSAPRRRKGTRMFAVSGHVKQPGVFEVEFGVTTFRDLIYAPVYGGGIRGDRELKAFIPGGASAPWFFEEHLDLPLEKAHRRQGRLDARLGRHRRDGRDHRRGARPACGVVRFFARESCGKCTPCREGTTWLEQILAAHPRRLRPPRATSTCCWTSATTSAPASPGRPKQTTICPLGPSAVSPIASAIERFRPRVRGLHRRGPRRVAGRGRRSPSRRRRPSRRPMPDARGHRRDGVTVTINGKRDRGRARASCVIDAAERNGVYIPRFCYHPRMKPVGMCRMCIVEIDTGRGPALQPSCMIECTPGHEGRHRVATVTKKAQDGVLEFLLINHPLDCPVCDKGGECPLQDQTMAYGPGESRFVEEKRHYEKPIPISDLVLLDRERCILCDRCTRFAKDVAGDPLIHFINRGSRHRGQHLPRPAVRVVLQRQHRADLPGRARSPPRRYRFKARPWDLDQVESTCTGLLGRLPGLDRVVAATRCCATRASTSTRSTGAGCATRAASASRPSISDDRLGEPLRARRRRPRRRPAGSRRSAQAADALRGRCARRGPGLDRRARRRPPHQRGRLRLGQAGQGRDRHRQRRRPARRRPARPRSCSACRGPRSTRCAPRAARCILLGPDLKEELPVLFLRLRHAVVERRRHGHRDQPRRPPASRRYAAVSLHPRPGEAGATVARPARRRRAGTDAGGVDADGAGRGRRAGSADGPGHRRPRPPVAGRVGRRRRRRRRRRCSPRRPDARFLPGAAPGQRARRARHGPGARAAARPGHARRRAATGSPARGRGVPAERRPRRRAASSQAAADGRIDVLVLLGADPLADFPDRDLAAPGAGRGPHGHRPRQFLNDSARQADVVLPAAGFAEVDGHHHQHRGPGQHAQPEGHRRPAPPGPTGSSPPSWPAGSAPTSGSSRSTASGRDRRAGPGLRRASPPTLLESPAPTTASWCRSGRAGRRRTSCAAPRATRRGPRPPTTDDGRGRRDEADDAEPDERPSPSRRRRRRSLAFVAGAALDAAGARRLLAAPGRHPQALRPGHARAAGRRRWPGSRRARILAREPLRLRPARRGRRRPGAACTSSRATLDRRDRRRRRRARGARRRWCFNQPGAARRRPDRRRRTPVTDVRVETDGDVRPWCDPLLIEPIDDWRRRRSS